MKLKNKKTGEIIETDAELSIKEPTSPTFGCPSYDIIASYNSLAELAEEWEDYEEPKEYFYIYADGDIYKDIQDDVRKDNGCKEIGNYFETKEEAEKAVEKLKAWKRLKDKGLTFCGWKFTDDCSVDVETTLDAEIVRTKQKYITDDLDLLFGSEVCKN